MVPDDGDVLWPSLGPQVCDWIEENLVFGPGDLRGEPAVIDAEKRGLIYRMYEVFPEDHENAGRRRFKRVGISLPKGLAKTEVAAWIAATELHPEGPVRTVDWVDGTPIGGPVTDPYIPMVAYTEEQSDELAYGALRNILSESPVAGDFDIGLERIMRRAGDGKAVSLSNSPSARDGARTTFQLADETHHFTLEKLRKAHQTMLANVPKRRAADAWSLEVTTAYEPGANSVAESTMEYAKSIADGRSKDAKLFYFHRQAGDHYDLEEEEDVKEAVLEASGPFGLFRDVDAIVELWRDPTTDRKFWERVWLNRPVQSNLKAFDIEAFRKRKSTTHIPDGSLIAIGFDGAQVRDSTALIATHIPTGYQWLAGLWERPYGPKGDKWRVPVDEVDACVESLFSRYKVWRMYADPPYWQSHISAWQGLYGDKKVIEWWTNRRKQMAYALEGYCTAIDEGLISHDGNEDVDRHIANAYKHNLPMRDDEGNPLWLIQKERADSPNKIDIAMAAVLSWECRSDAIASGVTEDRVFDLEDDESIYEEIEV
jgi:phage terminase large subunit-like protein